MTAKFSKHIKNFLPPVLVKTYRGLSSSKYGFFGTYNSWEEACKNSTGYDSDVIVEKVKKSLLKVKNGVAVYERDSLLFDQIEYSWPLLACLMLVAAIKENSLSVLDFGGSLGSTYFQNRKFLENLRNVQWGIVEQSKFVETGKDSFENETLKFFYDIDTCIKEIKPDVVILSSVLPYLETPYKFLEELLQRNIDYIIIDRTPVVDSNNDILTIQKVPPEIYEASYPAWFFSRQRLFNTIQKKYSLIEEFEALAGGIDIHNTKFSAIDKGFFLKRRD